MDAREPKEIEDARTCIFVKGTHVGERAGPAMKDLMALKRPHAISFSKKNTVRPFEDTSSFEFWAQKNDASLFVVAQSTKKRPDGLTFVRMYDGKVLDLVEVGVDNFVGMAELKTPKCTPGHRPLLHFASPLFDTHPRYIQLRSLLIDFFNGQVTPEVHTKGIEHVISITTAPVPENLDLTAESVSGGKTPLPKVYVRSYTISQQASSKDGAADAAHRPSSSLKPTPSSSSTSNLKPLTLTPMGPSLDLTLRRHTPPDAELLRLALKRPKLAQASVQKGLGKKKKNLEVDEMGDLRGRIHVGKQDLRGLEGKRMKGLRGEQQEAVVMDLDGEGSGGEEEEPVRKKSKKARTE